MTRSEDLCDIVAVSSYLQAETRSLYLKKYKLFKVSAMRATAKDLRFRVKELLETVTRGEEVVITYRGKACAKPIPIEKDNYAEDELFGIWKDISESENVNKYIRKIRKGRFQIN
jgi:antitoxin (DNA-binding transcriptional repressor) of toxin-antitoxin stability system